MTAKRGIDYAALRGMVSLEQVLQLLSYKPAVIRGQNWRGACPLHKPSSPRATCFSASLDRNLVYRPLIYRVGRRHGLQDADAQNLTQDVLQKVQRQAERWESGQTRGSFRRWLATVARNAAIDAIRRVELMPRTRENAFKSDRDRKRLSAEERAALYDELKDKIDREGFLPEFPITVMLRRKDDMEDKILQGHHRLAIAIELGLPVVPVRFVW